MDSADPPLAVHGLYAGRDHQYRRHSTEEVHEHDGPVSGGPARLTVCHRPVFVRAAVCHQVAQRATPPERGCDVWLYPLKPKAARGPPVVFSIRIETRIIRTCKEYPGAQSRSARCCSSRPTQKEDRKCNLSNLKSRSRL